MNYDTRSARNRIDTLVDIHRRLKYHGLLTPQTSNELLDEIMDLEEELAKEKTITRPASHSNRFVMHFLNINVPFIISPVLETGKERKRNGKRKVSRLVRRSYERPGY